MGKARRHFVGLSGWVLLIQIAAGALQAQDPQPRFLPAGISGRSHSIVNAMAQDRDGFLWLGTWDGLDRYDGYRILSFHHDPEDSASLSHNYVSALFLDREGRLWVGTELGLNRFVPESQSFARYLLDPAAARGDGSTIIWAIHETEDGQLWVGSGGGLHRYDPGADRFVPVASGGHGLAPETPTVVGIQADPLGALWILTSGYPHDQSAAALYRLDTTSQALEPYRLHQPGRSSLSFLIDREGRFWTGGTVPHRLDPVRRQTVSLRRLEPEPEPAWALHEDRVGRVWIGTSAGLHLQEPGSDAPIPVRLDDQATWLHDFVRSILEDDSGTIWVGTQGGLYRYDPAAKAFAHLGENRDDPERGLSTPAVAALALGPDGDLWVGSYGLGLDRIDLESGELRRYRAAPARRGGLPSDVIRALLLDSSGTLWIGAWNHLCSYRPGTDDFACAPIPITAGNQYITALIEDPDGAMWIGTSLSGLFRHDPVSGRIVRYPDGAETQALSSASIQGLALAGEEALWIGTMEGSLDRLDLRSAAIGHFPLVDQHGTPIAARDIYDLYFEPRGVLWVGSSAGLFRVDPAAGTMRHYTQRDGLPGSYVSALLPDQTGRLWLSTNRGLVRFDPRRPEGEQFDNFDLSDGIGGLEFNRRARTRAADGRLFFGGMHGVTWFDPEQIRDNPHVPRLALTEVRVGGRGGELRRTPCAPGGIVLQPRDLYVSFEFAALSFTAPAKNRYRYRLEGFDAGWVDAGAHRFVTFTHLPPGDYTFHLQGSNNDGVWNQVGLALPLRVLPAFWMTGWFRLLMVVVFVTLAAAAYRLRVARLLEIERLRVRIAGDLHDDLSSDLSGIALAMELIEKRGALSEAERRRVSQVRSTALRMIDGVRDIVWYVNPEHDTLESLVRRMKSAAGTLLAGREIEIETELSETPPAVDMAFRRHLFLLFKELLHNIAKHSQARRVWIRLREAGGQLALRVADDGVGFDPDATAPGEGLGNLKRRAQRLGGRLEINSRIGGGTEIDFETRIGRLRQSAAF